jgi:uncharacterized protein HemX
MERPLAALVALAALLCLGSTAFAQRQVETAPPARSAQISDEDLQTFAKIYVDLQKSIANHEARLADTQTEQDAREVQASFEKESVATVTRHGWSPEKYNSVVDAINGDQQLAEKAIALIDN